MFLPETARLTQHCIHKFQTRIPGAYLTGAEHTTHQTRTHQPEYCRDINSMNGGESHKAVQSDGETKTNKHAII